VNGNGNDDRIWRWRKVDVLFVLGCLTAIYGLVKGRTDMVIAGGGLAAIPFTQRGDKG
jgi:hypothetical protein